LLKPQTELQAGLSAGTVSGPRFINVSTQTELKNKKANKTKKERRRGSSILEGVVFDNLPWAKYMKRGDPQQAMSESKVQTICYGL
jgi:hypothetical protein